MITVYDNFLDEEDFIFLQEKSDEILKNPYTLIPNTYWPECIKLDSNLVLTCQTDEIHNVIEKIVSKKIQKSFDACMIYYWFPMSHIPWHQDHKYSGGLTIFLNDDWNINQGGLFMFSESNSIENMKSLHTTGIFPIRNRAIEQTNNVIHSVCPLSKNAEIRKTIQVFYK